MCFSNSGSNSDLKNKSLETGRFNFRTLYDRNDTNYVKVKPELRYLFL